MGQDLWDSKESLISEKRDRDVDKKSGRGVLQNLGSFKKRLPQILPWLESSVWEEGGYQRQGGRAWT